ncbi:helix-turn-helix domain-containing protein [Mycolicibacterium hippocampi]|uniref:helix-turn-helix domain-containing protein n=1 Tax=Mycobacteriaceae TaxID=1762 RepID=UPI002117076F|nr:helix-turn-helix domain-containing protein [Mycolicibacterium hippocampi]
MRRGVAANGRKRGRPRKVDDAAAAKARSLRGKGIASADIAKMMGVSRATVYRYPAKLTPATITSGTRVAGCNYDHRSSRGCAVTACASSRQLAKQLYDAQRVVDVRNERTPGTGMMSEAGVDAVKAESTREVEPVLAIDGAGVHGSSKGETCAASGSRGDVRCAVSCHRHNYAWFRAHRLGIRRPARACGPAAV